MIGGEIVKNHKYWAVGALACMIATFCTGFKGKMKAHKIFAVGAMAVSYTHLTLPTTPYV